MAPVGAVAFVAEASSPYQRDDLAGAPGTWGLVTKADATGTNGPVGFRAMVGNGCLSPGLVKHSDPVKVNGCETGVLMPTAGAGIALMTGVADKGG